ncbi:ammonium transporter [Telmatobacter bradus]|uniref:ammonium transporter n=1 Tax=Telmatobacter bradus TaxID=474953 RepID=UPI003B430C89
MSRGIKLLFLALCLFPATLGLAQAAAATPAAPAAASASTQAQIDALQQALKATQAAAASAQSSGDNAWMLVSAAFVLLMTGPGLALFYGGLVRQKNILGTMMQSFAMMGLITILWAVVGYSLCFGHGNAFIGGFEHIFLKGVGLTPNADYAATIPEQTFMVYQLMFAIITPALITGAFAERMKFSSMAVFLSLWSLIVYSPMAHMVWGVGGFLNISGGVVPSLDFAGGTVVHITSGVSALVTALYLGKRAGYPHTKMSPHSLVLSFIGACLLWFGWFGFNAGSALAANGLATSAFVNTHFAAAAAALSWTIAEWIHNGKPTALGAISGAVAGLVAITPASGFVQPMSAIIIGLIAGIFCPFMVFKVKAMFGYDDSLDAFGVHGAGGTLGAVLTGLFAASVINPVFKDKAGNVLPSGAIEGHWHQVLNQLGGIGLAWGISIVGTLVLLFVVDKTMGLRLSPDAEAEGMDLNQHGEEGYDFNG